MPGGQASNQPSATARAETGSLHSRGWPRPLGRSQALLISNFTLGYDRFPVHAQVPAVTGGWCRSSGARTRRAGMGDLRAVLIRIAGQVSGRMVKVDIATGCRRLPSCEKGSRLLGFAKSSGPANPKARWTRLGEDRSRRTLSGRLRPVRLFRRRVLGATLAGRSAGGGGGSCVSSSASTSWRCRVVA